jgi:hypothetical protein
MPVKLVRDEKLARPNVNGSGAREINQHVGPDGR